MMLSFSKNCICQVFENSIPYSHVLFCQVFYKPFPINLTAISSFIWYLYRKVTNLFRSDSFIQTKLHFLWVIIIILLINRDSAKTFLGDSKQKQLERFNYLWNFYNQFSSPFYGVITTQILGRGWKKTWSSNNDSLPRKSVYLYRFWYGINGQLTGWPILTAVDSSLMVSHIKIWE